MHCGCSVAEHFRGFNQTKAMTKADYDKFVEEKGRTPGDAKWTIPQRGQVQPQLTHQDPSVRTDAPATAERQRKYMKRKREREAKE